MLSPKTTMGPVPYMLLRTLWDRSHDRSQDTYGTGPIAHMGLQNITSQKKIFLYEVTPYKGYTSECVVMFLGGSLPAAALLHLKMLSILEMIAWLGPTNVLHQHGRNVLVSCILHLA